MSESHPSYGTSTTPTKERCFRLHWLSGRPQDIYTRHTGSRMEAAAAAMNEAGIGAGALGALDYWEELTPCE